MSNTKTQEACTQEKRENLQFLINLNTRKNKTIQMETANFNIRPHQKDITDMTLTLIFTFLMHFILLVFTILPYDYDWLYPHRGGHHVLPKGYRGLWWWWERENRHLWSLECPWKNGDALLIILTLQTDIGSRHR